MCSDTLRFTELENCVHADQIEMRDKIKRCRILCGKPEGKGTLVRTKRRSEDDIKMDLQELEWEVWTGFIWLSIWTNGILL